MTPRFKPGDRARRIAGPISTIEDIGRLHYVGATCTDPRTGEQRIYLGTNPRIGRQHAHSAHCFERVAVPEFIPKNL
jgi:hypothetical protein